MKSPIEVYLAFDLETTGLVAGKHAIAEIACCAFDCDLNDISEYNSGIIKPLENQEITDKALEINGISRKQLENGREPKEVLDEFIKYLKSFKKTASKIMLVGHNIDNFDIPHLVFFFEYFKKDLSKYVTDKITMDTMWWGRLKWVEMSNFQLGTCCQEVGVTLVDGHRALNDTRSNKELAKNFLRSLRNEGVNNSIKQERPRIKFEF